MSKQKYAAPLRLEPERSRRLAVLMMLGLAGAVLLPFTVPVPGVARVFLVVLTAASAYRLYRRYLGNERIVLAVWNELGQWQLQLADGTEWEVELEGDSFVTPEAMILNFRTTQKRFHWIVLKDVLEQDTLRRLRVRLRLESWQTTASAPDASEPGK